MTKKTAVRGDADKKTDSKSKKKRTKANDAVDARWKAAQEERERRERERDRKEKRRRKRRSGRKKGQASLAS